MKRFLVAHPDEYTRRTLETAIADLGYTFELIQDGLDVVDRTLDDHPDAILLGLSLPGVGGLQVARTLRTLQTTQAIPILFITDSSAESTRVLQAALPGVACLQSPFELGRVRDQLARLVTRNANGDASSKTASSPEALEITDPPTGLFSRTYILHRLAYEGARAARYHHNLGVVIIAVRNLDQIVKRHGQRGADSICMDVASIVRRTVRMVDLVGRTATDEFLVILPETDVAGGKITAERLCSVLDAAEYQVLGTREKIQTCAGVAGVSHPNLDNNLALFAQAEIALKYARDNPTAQIISNRHT